MIRAIKQALNLEPPPLELPPVKTPELPPQEQDQVILGMPFYPDAVAQALEAKLKEKK